MPVAHPAESAAPASAAAEPDAGADASDARQVALVPSEHSACPDGCKNATSEPHDTTPGSVACSFDIAWNSPSWIDNHTDAAPTRNLRADSHGNVYYVGSFAHDVDFGLGTTSANWEDAFVLKLSPSCTPIWFKQISGHDGQTTVSFTSIAIDGDDDLIIAGDFDGTADFGAGEITTVTSEQSRDHVGLVLELAPDGTLSWTRTLSAAAATYLDGVGVTDAGEVIVSGSSDSAVHFDGTPAPEELAYSSVFVASIGAGGEPGAIHQIISSETFGMIAVDGSGRVAISGWAYDARGTGAFAGFDWGAKLYDHYLLVLDPGGALAWSRHLEQISQQDIDGLWGSSIEFDREGAVILEYGRSFFHDDGTITHQPRIVQKIDGHGTDVWMRSSQYAGGEIMWRDRLATDTHDNIVYVEELTDDTTLDGKSFDVRGKRDFLVRKRDSNGELIWSAQIGGDGADANWALATDASDAVWVGSEQIDDAFEHATITITKLVP